MATTATSPGQPHRHPPRFTARAPSRAEPPRLRTRSGLAHLAGGRGVRAPQHRVTGLASAEAAAAPSSLWATRAAGAEPCVAWHTFAAQFQNVLILILLGAHSYPDSSVTRSRPSSLLVSCFRRATRFHPGTPCGASARGLEKDGCAVARVLRDKEETVVPSRDLVPGDVVLLRTGDRVPAMRGCSGQSIWPWTNRPHSESAAVEKTVARFDDARLSLGAPEENDVRGDAGRLRARPGRGRIDRHVDGVRHVARLVETVEAADAFAREPRSSVPPWARQAGLVVVAIVVAIGLARGLPVSTCSCSAVRWRSRSFPGPAGRRHDFVAIGVRRMVKRNALVRVLPIVEPGEHVRICTTRPAR